MSAQDFRAAAAQLRVAAAAYRVALRGQGEAHAAMSTGISALVSGEMSPELRQQVEGYNAACAQAALLAVPTGHAALVAAEVEVRALEEVANAAERVAAAITNMQPLVPEGGDA